MPGLTAQEVANLVIGKSVYDSHAFAQLMESVDGKPLEFISDVLAAVPEPISNSETAPDALQLSAISYLADQMAHLIANEVLFADEDNQYQIAQKCRRIFIPSWTTSFLAHEIKRRIEDAPNKGVVYHILGLTLMGEGAEELIAMHSAEAR